jgi:hypothetical protein
MKRLVRAATFLGATFVTGSAWASLSVSVAPSGGRPAFAVSIDPARRLVRYASCVSEPCQVGPDSPALTVPFDAAVDAARTTVDEVRLAGGRRLVHVRIPLSPGDAPESPAWEALLAPGSPPLFEGVTGWQRGEPGERTGTDVRFLTTEGVSTVVIGEVREDMHVCGDEATLLDPRGLDPSTLVFHGATLQRLSAARRDGAIPVTATPLHGGPRPSLVPLLTATEASSAIGSAAALTDGDVATTWSEARPGRGQGEFVVLRAPFDVPIVRFEIVVAPTRPKPDGAAPRSLYIAANDATYEVSFAEDAWGHPGEAYEVVLPKPLQSSCISLVLDDAYVRGRAHPDVSLAEVVAYSAFDHEGATLPEVSAALRGDDPRAPSAAALLERGGAPGLAAIVAAYSSLDAAGRALAVNVAASSPSCEAASGVLVSAVSDPDELVREKALAKLEQPKCGAEALPALTAALATPGRIRVAPLVALLGRQRSLGALLARLGEGTSEERHAMRGAVAFAAKNADVADVRQGLDATAKRGPDAALDVLRALQGRLGDVEDVALVRTRELLAAHPPFATRYLLVNVLGALAALHDGPARALYGEVLLHDPSPAVRALAAEGAAAQPDAVLLVAVRDEAPRVREAALRSAAGAHRTLPPGALEPLLEADPWTFVRVAAASLLSGMPAGADADRLLAHAAGQLAVRVREQALRGLGAHRAAAYANVVREHLSDVHEDGTVRLAAARAAGELCDAASVDLLARLAITGGSSTDALEVALGLAATDALGALHPKGLASRLAPLSAKSARPDARVAAARAVAAKAECPLP